MKYLNLNNVQVAVTASTGIYYLPPRKAQNIPGEVKSLPKGVKPIVEKAPEPKQNTNSKKK